MCSIGWPTVQANPTRNPTNWSTFFRQIWTSTYLKFGHLNQSCYPTAWLRLHSAGVSSRPVRNWVRYLYPLLSVHTKTLKEPFILLNKTTKVISTNLKIGSKTYHNIQHPPILFQRLHDLNWYPNSSMRSYSTNWITTTDLRHSRKYHLTHTNTYRI